MIVVPDAARFVLLRLYHHSIPGALAYGPGLLSVAHGPHEFVAVKKLAEAAEVYALTAATLLS